MVFTVDTGATRTILSRKMYDRLLKGARPQLRGAALLRGAGGAYIKEHGRAAFQVRFGRMELEREMTVAYIEDEALLGCDVLCGSDNVPADIILSKGVIVINGQDVPCIQRSAVDYARKVTVAIDTSVPALSKALVDVFVDRRRTDDNAGCAEYLVEAGQQFARPHQSRTDVQNSRAQSLFIPIHFTLRQNFTRYSGPCVSNCISVSE